MDAEKDSEVEEKVLSVTKAPEVISIDDNDEDDQPALEKKADIQNNDSEAKEAEKHIDGPMDIVEDKEPRENVGSDKEKSEAESGKDVTTEASKSLEVVEEMEEAVPEPESIDKEKLNENQDAGSKQKGGTDDDIILIDDEKEITEKADSKEQQISEPEKSSDKEEPVQKKGRLSTEEKEGFQSVTGDSENAESREQQVSDKGERSDKAEPVQEKERLSTEEQEESQVATEISEQSKKQQESRETHEAKERKPVAPAEEKPEDDSNVKEDDDVVMVECESKCSETTGDSEEAKKQQKETTETHEAKEGGSLNPAEKEPTDAKVKEDEVKEGKPVSPAEEKSAADSNVMEDDDVVMVEGALKSSETAVDSEESKEQQKETTETHEAKEGEPLKPAEKEPTPDPKIKEDEVEEGKSVSPAEEKSAADSNVKEDDDVVMVEGESKSSEPAVDSKESKKQQKETAETHEAKEGEPLNPAEKEPTPDTKVKQDEVKEGKPMNSVVEKPAADTKVKEDDDVVMVRCESKSSKTTDRDEKKPEELAATPKMEDNDDVMLIESDEHPKEATTDKSKTDEKDSIDKDQSGAPSKDATDKDQSGTHSKDESDDVMVVECHESIAESDSETDKKEEKVESSKKDEVQKEAATKPTTVEDTADKPTEKAESDESKANNQPKKSTPTKRFVLDEKSGMFEEKEAPPEEPVPQVFGDSDEDVVMVDNYVTTDRKSAAKPAPAPSPKPQPVVPKSTAAAQPLPTKEVSKELSRPKSTSSSATVECINMECKKESKETAPAPGFVLNFFGIPKKTKKQRICVNCYDEVVEKYSVLGGAVLDQQPLLFCEMPRKNELVEISDSSEEEEDEDVKLESEKPLSSDIISLVESELNDIIASTFEKININQQIDWTEQIMKQKIAYNSKLSNEINNELNELQRKVDRIHLQLYSKSRPRYQDLPPCNIFEVDPQTRQAVVQQSTAPSRPYTLQRPSIQQQLPQQQRQQAQMTVGIQAAASPSGPAAPKKEEFSRPAVNVGQFYFAVKHKLLSNWAECQVVEAVSVADKSLYKVNFLYNQGAGAAPIKVVPAKYLAYRHSFNVKLPLGTRVIARFDAGTTLPSAKQSQQAKNNSFYPGIIAESFGKYNRNRYLIFFDDGYAQYVTHGDVRVVCEESKEVWSDIHPHSQEFIKNYLMNYRSQRPMVQVKVGQRIITEWKGKWIYAKVIDIDASLVQLHFADDNRYEWIYRGSTRLGPLYQEKALSMSKASNKFSKFQKRNEPSIEYITLDDDEENDQNKQQEARKPSTTQELALQSFKNLQLNQADSANRSVAKKSTFHRAVPASQPSAVFMNSSTIYCEDDRPKGKIVYYTAKKHLPPLKYKPHECNPSCLFKITHNLKSYSPMAKPLLSGWERQLCKMKYKKVFVVYRAPCGRRVRNMYELHMYLRMTKATLNVENFDFDPMIHCLAEYVIENHIYHNPVSILGGKKYEGYVFKDFKKNGFDMVYVIASQNGGTRTSTK